MIGWLEQWWAGVPGTAVSDFAGLAGLLLTLLALGWAWWHTRCRVLWCVRPGRHPVHRTTWKVCSTHHTVEQHRRLHARHAARHPDRLGHGDSWHSAPGPAPAPPADVAA